MSRIPQPYTGLGDFGVTQHPVCMLSDVPDATNHRTRSMRDSSHLGLFPEVATVQAEIIEVARFRNLSEGSF